jgi:hypothetical protein
MSPARASSFLLVAALLAGAACSWLVRLDGGACLVDEHCPADAGLVCAAAGSSCTCRPAGPGVVACSAAFAPWDAGAWDGGGFGVDGGELDPLFQWAVNEYWVSPTLDAGPVMFSAQVPGVVFAVDGAPQAGPWLVVPPLRLGDRAELTLTARLPDGGPWVVNGQAQGPYLLRVMPRPSRLVGTVAFNGAGSSLASAADLVAIGEAGAVSLALSSPAPLLELRAGSAYQPSLSLAGGFLAVGAPGLDGGQLTIYRVYVDGGLHAAQEYEAQLPDQVRGASIGVAVSADGVVACNLGPQRTAVFVRAPDAGWEQQVLLDAGGPAGTSLALSMAGLVVATASPVASSPFIPGAVRWHGRRDGTWLPAEPLRGPDGGVLQWFDPTLALTEDTLVVGDKSADLGLFTSGGVRVFRRGDAGWLLDSTLSTDVAYEAFGAAVSLEHDWLAVGVPGHGRGGSVRLFQREAAGWREVGRLAPTQDVANADFGSSVAFTTNWLVVGAPGCTVPNRPSAGCVSFFPR